MTAIRLREMATSAVSSIWLPAVLIAAWWIVSTVHPTFAFPAFGQIVDALFSTWFGEMFLTDLLPSIGLVFQALAIAVIVGVVLGVLIGSSRLADAAARPFLDFMRGLPKVLLISPALIIIGVGDALTLFVLSFGAVWPILLGTIDGVKGVEPILRDMRATYRITRRTWLTKIALPSASPQIFAGIRNAVALAVVLLVPAQAVGATGGLGFQLKQASDRLLFTDVWATIIVFAIVGYTLATLLTVIERRALKWFYKKQGAIS